MEIKIESQNTWTVEESGEIIGTIAKKIDDINREYFAVNKFSNFPHPDHVQSFLTFDQAKKFFVKPKYTARDLRAFEILKAGGYFRHALETNSYTRREQFQIRLRNAQHQVIEGIGFATKNKFISAGLLRSVSETSSTWGTNYYLSPEVKFALILCGEI